MEVMGALGLGSKAHNQYQFGSESKSGLTHYEAGFQWSWPGMYENYYPLAQLYYYSVLENKAGSLLGGQDKGIQANLTLGFHVFGI